MNPQTGAAISLAWTDLLIAAALVLIAGGVSLAMRLQVERRLGLAALRTAVQLLLIGYVLRWVFAIRSPWAIGGVVLVMVATATHTAVRRPSRSFRGLSQRAFVTLAATGLLTTVTATRWIVGAQPWYAPHYFIPLFGMVLGNTMTGVSLCVDHLLETLSERRGEVEMELAHGASRWEAARGPLAEAVRRAMIPLINSMMVIGIVSLPGMMTGQILAGADPLEAVKYQIMIMFMLAAGVSLGSMSIALLAYRRLFNERHQLADGLLRRH